MDVDINYLAVFLAAISSMVIGTVWYSPPVFGKMWASTYREDKARAKKEMPLVMSLTFLGSLLMAFVLAHVTFLSNKFFGNGFLQDAMATAFWLWLGLSVPAVLGGLFEQRRKLAMALQIGNILVTLEIMALIIGLMKP